MVSKIIQALNDAFGANFKNDDITEWNFFSEGSTCTILTQEQQNFVRHLLNEPGFCRDLKLMPHAEEVLSQLSKSGCKITWLTAPWKTSPTWIQDRTDMIMEKLSHISTDIIFSWNKEETPGDLLIDDNPEFLLKWLNKNYKAHIHGPQIFLFKQPWNIKFGEEHKLSFLDGWKDKKLAYAVVMHKVLR